MLGPELEVVLNLRASGSKQLRRKRELALDYNNHALRGGEGVILPMPVLMLKMSLPKMIILFDDYNGRHYPVEVKIIQLPKKNWMEN